MKDEICKHCKMLIEERNPSGFCDHLFYPENCKVCSNEAFEEMDCWLAMKHIEKCKKCKNEINKINKKNHVNF